MASRGRKTRSSDHVCHGPECQWRLGVLYDEAATYFNRTTVPAPERGDVGYEPDESCSAVIDSHPAAHLTYIMAVRMRDAVVARVESHPMSDEVSVPQHAGEAMAEDLVGGAGDLYRTINLIILQIAFTNS